MAKTLLPPISCIVSKNKWTKSFTGTLFFISILIIFIYSISILSNINRVLISGSAAKYEDFITMYGISRGSLERYNGVFIAILLISGSIVFYSIWTVLPYDYQCMIFSPYTILLFTIFLLIITSMTINDISPKHFTTMFTRISNILVLALTVLILLYYIQIIFTHHSSKKK